VKIVGNFFDRSAAFDITIYNSNEGDLARERSGYGLLVPPGHPAPPLLTLPTGPSSTEAIIKALRRHFA